MLNCIYHYTDQTEGVTVKFIHTTKMFHINKCAQRDDLVHKISILNQTST